MMQGMGLPKHLLGDDEELVMTIRSHKRVLIAPALILVLVLLVAGLLWAIVPTGSAEPWLRWAIVIVAAVLIARWVIWPFVQWWSSVYAITTHRLVTRTGVIRRSGHDMPLSRLNDVSFSHSLIQRMLGCGTMVVESGGEQGQLVLRDIPDVETVQRTLYQLAEDARQGEFGASLERRPEPRGDARRDEERRDDQRRDDERRDDERRDEERRDGATEEAEDVEARDEQTDGAATTPDLVRDVPDRSDGVPERSPELPERSRDLPDPAPPASPTA